MIVQEAVKVKVSATVAPANTRDRSNVKRILKIKIWNSATACFHPGKWPDQEDSITVRRAAGVRMGGHPYLWG